jgi:phenylpropionate dioxygenase-like ring-hydroxylating dioxygenase large terminal subunit
MSLNALIVRIVGERVGWVRFQFNLAAVAVSVASVGSVWLDIASSADVAPSGVLSVEVEHEELVVWRSAEGVLAACDARCPHQWAHLGSVGAVDGADLVCLSHFWRFAADGTGSKLAMNGRRDEKGAVRAHTVREVDGRIELRMSTD